MDVAVHVDVDRPPVTCKLQRSTWNWYYITPHTICIRFMHFFSMCSRIMRPISPTGWGKTGLISTLSAACTALQNAPLSFDNQSALLCDNSATIPLNGFKKSVCWQLHFSYYLPTFLNSSDFHEILLKNLNIIRNKKKSKCADIIHCTHFPCMFRSHF
jgi:hypothetical protein